MSDIANHQRINDILLGPLERPALKWMAAHMPAWVTPDHCTVFGVFATLRVARALPPAEVVRRRAEVERAAAALAGNAAPVLALERLLVGWFHGRA